MTFLSTHHCDITQQLNNPFPFKQFTRGPKKRRFKPPTRSFPPLIQTEEVTSHGCWPHGLRPAHLVWNGPCRPHRPETDRRTCCGVPRWSAEAEMDLGAVQSAVVLLLSCEVIPAGDWTAAPPLLLSALTLDVSVGLTACAPSFGMNTVSWSWKNCWKKENSKNSIKTSCEPSKLGLNLAKPFFFLIRFQAFKAFFFFQFLNMAWYSSHVPMVFPHTVL